jgi:Ca2+/Na+ antiporter
MSMFIVWILLIIVGVASIVWGAETFAEHLGAAAVRLKVSSFALAAVAGVVGSFTDNVTMTLGAAAIVRPLKIVDASLLHFPLLVMLGSLTLAIVLASFKGFLGKVAGGILVAAYPLFIVSIASNLRNPSVDFSSLSCLLLLIAP